MKGRLPLFVLLASALTFLASLYLPWQVSPRACNPAGTDCFSGTSSDAWSSSLGDAAAVIGVALVAATAAALVRRRLVGRLPLAAGALLAVYMGIATAALLRARVVGFAPFDHNVHFHWGYGAYLGVASGIAAAVVAAVIRGREVLPKRSTEALASALGLALLVSFLLPWHQIPLRQGVYNELGILSPAAVLAAVLVALGATVARMRPLLLLGAAVFTLGAFNFGGSSGQRGFGYWVGLGLTLALLGVALLAAGPELRASRQTRQDAVLAGAAGILVASLFLHWQSACLPQGRFPGIGRCIATNGWTLPGSAAAALASVAIVVVLIGLNAHRVPELAVGASLLITTAGFMIAEPPFESHRGYGAFVGFSATAIFLLLALSRLRGRPLERGRLVARLLPIATSLSCLAAIALAWWGVLPERWQAHATVLTGWLAAVGLLLALRTLWAWFDNAGGPSAVGGELVLAPLGLLALVAVALIETREIGLTWGGGILVGLCLLLTALGWIEMRRGLENAGFSEILRVDRIPEAET
jgi:hypothetical protein